MRQLRELLPAGGPFKTKWSTGKFIYDPRHVSGEKKGKEKNRISLSIFSLVLS